MLFTVVLVSGFFDGCLPGVDIKALRDQARDVLLKGSENGGLAEALKSSGVVRQPPKAEGPDLIALRNQAIQNRESLKDS